MEGREGGREGVVGLYLNTASWTGSYRTSKVGLHLVHNFSNGQIIMIRLQGYSYFT